MGPLTLLKNIRSGRMQRLLCLATAEEHQRGNAHDAFGDKWMWTPIVLTPPLTAAAIAGFYSERAATRWLPFFGALYAIDGLIGIATHVRGVRKRPGGFAEPTYNLVMGPPLLAPGSLAMVGTFGVVAALVRREK